MRPRVQRLKERNVTKSFRGETYADERTYVDVERARYWTQSYMETEGEPEVLRRAKALSNLLDKMTIYIEDDDLIVGNAARDPFAIPPTTELSDEANRESVNDGFVKEEDKEEFKKYLDYWAPKNMWARVRREGRLGEDAILIASSNYTAEASTARDGFSSAQPDHDFIFANGWGNILKRIEEKAAAAVGKIHEGLTTSETIAKLDEWEAMKISVEAFMRWHRRYAFLAKEVAAQETDPARKKELHQMAANLEHLATKPPASFWQAVQEHWLVQMVTHQLERYGLGVSERIDQMLYAFYEKDKKEGKLTWDDALEIIECLWLKLQAQGRVSTRALREALQGVALLQVYTLGGVKADGSDACNDLTRICMQASRDAKTYQPSYALRYHPRIGTEYLLESLENLKAGLGMPSFENDSVVIPMLMSGFGATLEQARNWALILCKSPGPVGAYGTPRRRPFQTNAIGCFSLALSRGIYNGPYEKFIGKRLGPDSGDPGQWKSMEDCYEAFRKQYIHCFKMGWLMRNTCHDVEEKYYKQPFLSACFEPFIDMGKDCMEADMLPVPWYNVVGLIDTGDSMTAMKKWIFDKNGAPRKYTMSQLLKALDANWEGFDEMRQDFASAPAWGNDDDYADSVTAEIFSLITEEGLKFTDKWGARPRPVPQSVTSFKQLGRITPATPNGRKAGTVLADGGDSPYYGCDKNGPTAVLKSCSKLDNTQAKGMLLNQRISPASVEGEKGRQVFLSYLKAWHDLNVEHVQINMVNSDVLLAAQSDPQKYSDLIVRVAGYSAYFIELDKETQDSIIARSEQVLVA